MQERQHTKTASLYYRLGPLHQEEQQCKSGKSNPSINTASLPCHVKPWLARYARSPDVLKRDPV